jgi:hypothetical protein
MIGQDGQHRGGAALRHRADDRAGHFVGRRRERKRADAVAGVSAVLGAVAILPVKGVR